MLFRLEMPGLDCGIKEHMKKQLWVIEKRRGRLFILLFCGGGSKRQLKQ